MQFTSSIIAAILAASSLSLAAPLEVRNTPKPTPDAPASAPAAPKDPLLTQKLLFSDLASDRFKLLPNNEDFVFDFNQEKGKGGKGGDLFAANRKTFAALVGAGSGMAVGFLGPCGFNTPHIHPRATELQIVVKGTLVTEMLPENGVFNGADKTTGRRVIRNELTQFQMQPFYQGSVHAQFNPTCEEAIFIASFNNEDFGTGQVVDELVAMDNEIVAAAFGQSVAGSEVAEFKKNKVIPESIALGVEQCLATCKIAAK